MTAATVSLLPAAGTSRPSAPSLALLTSIEVRKSLSTRSGKAVAVVASLIGPVAVGIGSLGGEGTAPAAAILGFTATLSALVLLALGVLSTAGEWTHKSVQTTYLLVPQRGRVMTAKLAALVLQGAVFAAVSAALSVLMLAVIPDPVAWTGVGRAVGIAVVTGAAFAVIGAGIGAALGNSPAALTGTYLAMLGVMPILQVLKPTWAEKLDPVTSSVVLAQGMETTTPALVITGWVVVATLAGVLISRRRSVQ